MVSPFFSQKAYRRVYQSGNLLSKIYGITESYLKRASLLFRLSPYEFVFIHREATPAGPPIIEFVIAKLFKKKIIYDFDDAIWLTDRNDEPLLFHWIRCRWKVGRICSWSHRISVGNEYLAQYARKFNRHTVVNPTTIDTLTLHTPRASENPQKDHVTIGWTGSHSTLKYLGHIVPVLQLLEKKYSQIRILIIADKDPHLRLENAYFRPWRIESEVTDLCETDIGIMPMPDDEWTQGKCGLKALQYMALEIPALASPVGVNKEIILHGMDGYLCASFADWFTSLEELINNPDKRVAMGRKGRQKVVDRYSVVSNADNFLSLFQ